MLSPQQFHGLADQLRTQGGFTVDVKTGSQPSSGVSVAEPGAERVLVNARGGSIASYAGEHRSLLEQPGLHLGGWRAGQLAGPPHGAEGAPVEQFSDNGKLTRRMNVRNEDYLDVSRVIPEHPRGHHIADVHNAMHVNRQIASFDLGNAKEIQNPRFQDYTDDEKAGGFSPADEYGSSVRIKRKS